MEEALQALLISQQKMCDTMAALPLQFAQAVVSLQRQQNVTTRNMEHDLVKNMKRYIINC